jgi:glycosyltransferase involved in cell wall biosynthesis
MPDNRDLLIVIPAYNEQDAIGAVIQGIRTAVPGVPILLLDDCSNDATVAVARAAGVDVLSLPHHLGLGGLVQTGYKLAFSLGYQYVIRVDGDGQHDPQDIPRIYEKLRTSGAEMVIGCRTNSQEPGNSGNKWKTGIIRRLGIVFFRAVLRPILGRTVHDPTSGFVGVNRAALQVFAASFPLEYPEIEALVVLQRRRFRFDEVPVKMHPRRTGRSSITPYKSLYYIVHVLLGVFVNILKYEGRTAGQKAKNRTAKR